MKFYEFNEFGYYALIGAETEDKAMEYYSETVSEIEDDEEGVPIEITKEEAKAKLIKACSKEEKSELVEEFDLCTSTSEPYLILIDGSLI